MTQSLPKVPRQHQQQHTWWGLEGIEVFVNSDEAIENAKGGETDTPKKKEQVSSSINLKEMGVMEVKVKAKRGILLLAWGSWTCYLFMFLGKRHLHRYGDSNGEMFRWCKNLLSFFSFFGVFLSRFYALSFLLVVLVRAKCLIPSFLVFMVVLSFFLLICVSFIPRNWNGGLDTFFCAYIQTYILTYGIGGF